MLGQNNEKALYSIQLKITYGVVNVICNNKIATQYEENDIEGRNLVIYFIKKFCQCSNVFISKIFNVDKSLITKILRDYEKHGLYGPPKQQKKDLKNALKINSECQQFIIDARRDGETYSAIVESIQKTMGEKISLSGARLAYNRVLSNNTQNLPKEEDVSTEILELEDSLLFAYQRKVKTLIKGIKYYDRCDQDFLKIDFNRHAGAYVLVGLASYFKLFNAYNNLIEDTRSGEQQYSVTQILLTTLLLFALRYDSVDEYKYADHEDLGEIIESLKSPSETEIRLIIGMIAKQNRSKEILLELFKTNLTLVPTFRNVFAIDGTFAEYTGKDPLPKGYNARRRVVMRGRTDNYLTDLSGRPLFFTSQSLNDGLSKGIKELVLDLDPNIALIDRPDPVKIIFDRGGFSYELFKWLTKHYPKIYFITFLKGRLKNREYPLEEFKKYQYQFNDKIHFYNLRVEIIEMKSGEKYKIITLLDDKSMRQIPIITNDIFLDKHLEMMSPAETVFYLKSRWGMVENPIKFMRRNYKIEQLITYQKENAPNEIKERLNPDRREINKNLKSIKKLIEQVLVEMAILKEALPGKDIIRKIPREKSLLEKELSDLRSKWQELNEMKKHISSKQEYNTRDEYLISNTEKRTLVNIIKTGIFNIERCIQDIILDIFDNKKDVFGFIHNIYERSGKIIKTKNMIIVCMKPFNCKHHNETLEHLLSTINSMQLTHPVNGKIVCYAMLKS